MLNLSKTTNFGLCQAERVCRRQFEFDEKNGKFSDRVENALGKEKLLVKSNFSYFRSVFKRRALQTRKNQGLFGKGLKRRSEYAIGMLCCIKPLLHRYSFSHINNRQLLKTLQENKKLIVRSNFFFSHNVVNSIRKLYPHVSIFLTSYLYLLLNWKSPKLAYKG